MGMFENLDKEKKQRIINAALQEFAHHGYQNASTNAMVIEAGISKGALFHYFGSKEKLYEYLMDYTYDTLETKIIKDFPASRDLLELFQIVTQRKLLLVQEYPLMFDFLYMVIREQPEHPAYKKLERQSEEMMKLLLKQKIETRCFRPGITAEHAMEISAWMMQGFVRKYVQTHNRLDGNVRKKMEELIQILRVMLYKEEYQ